MSVGEAFKKGGSKEKYLQVLHSSSSLVFSTAAALLRKVCWCAAIHIVISSSLHRHFSIRAVGGFKYPGGTN